MIETVLAHVANQIKADAPYLSKVGGYAWPQSIRVQDRVKILPACASDTGPEWMVPETKESAVVFFEANEATSEYQSVNTSIFKCPARLIVWLNTQRLAGSPDQIRADILRSIQSEIANTHPFNRIRCRVTSYNSGPGIFSRYTFDEAETQHLMPPFAYFAVNIDVTFAVSPACVFETVNQTAPQC